MKLSEEVRNAMKTGTTRFDLWADRIAVLEEAAITLDPDVPILDSMLTDCRERIATLEADLAEIREVCGQGVTDLGLKPAQRVTCSGCWNSVMRLLLRR